MSAYTVIVNTITQRITYVALAASSISAYMDAVNMFSDVACGISVNPLAGRAC